MIELRMLGRLSLTGDDGLEVRGLLGQPRRLALLAYLAAASPQGFHRRDTLLALFWPELDQEHARAALRQALHVVRDALGGDAVTSRGDEEIGLDFAQVSCDVAAFERTLRIGQLEEALDLYRGALLEGFFISDAPEFERWLETERARLQQAAAGGASREVDSRSHPLPPSKRRGGRLVMRVGLSAAGALALLVGFSVAGPRGRLHPRTPPTSNAQAYDLYLRANMLVNQRQNRENDSVAITLFERIVALDPSFAAAQAGLARAYALRVTEFAPGDTAALERARVAAEKALRLDPNLAEAHQAQARLLWGPANHFFHERAIQEDRRALSLDPNMDRAHQHLGNIYLHIGMLDEAIAELEKTLAISPREDNALRRIAEARTYQGRYQDGLKILSQVDPDANPPYWHYQMTLLLLHLGRRDSAFAVIRNYLRAHPDDRGGVVTSARAVWFALGGDAHRAEQDIRTAVQKGQGYIHFHHAGYHIALAYALLHRPDSAVQWLRTTAEGGLPRYPLFERGPFLDNIPRHSGFVAFMREQKVQWEQFRTTL